MKVILLYFSFALPLSVLGQSFPENKCAYTVEGMVADCISYEGVKHAIIKNIEHGICAITDENGYYNITFPLNYIDSGKVMGFEVFKDGYKINKWWVGYAPMDSNFTDRSENCLVWNYDLKIIKLSKLNESKTFNVTSHIRIDTIAHGFIGIKTSFDYFVKRSKINDQLDALKANSENVVFKIDGKYIICSNERSLFLNHQKAIIFVNNKKVKLKDVNKLLKRSETIENFEKRDEYYKANNYNHLVFFLEKKKVS